MSPKWGRLGAALSDFCGLQHLNFDSSFVPKGVTYYNTAILMDSNPIRTALNVCQFLISKQVSPLDGPLLPCWALDCFSWYLVGKGISWPFQPSQPVVRGASSKGTRLNNKGGERQQPPAHFDPVICP